MGEEESNKDQEPVFREQEAVISDMTLVYQSLDPNLDQFNQDQSNQGGTERTILNALNRSSN